MSLASLAMGSDREPGIWRIGILTQEFRRYDT